MLPFLRLGERGTPMNFTIRRVAGGGFAIDDGAGPPLSLCPCCALPLTERAAQAVVDKLEAGKLTMGTARMMVELLRELPAGRSA
jgi:hypothetical protein